jgi:hypothetical protein
VTLYAPLLLSLIAVSRHSWTIAALPCLPYLAEWIERRPRLDPLRWTAARIIEDVAYGCGVWVGCIRSRAVAPLPAGGESTEPPSVLLSVPGEQAVAISKARKPAQAAERRATGDAGKIRDGRVEWRRSDM